MKKMIVVERCGNCLFKWDCFTFHSEVPHDGVSSTCPLQDVPNISSLVEALENCVADMEALVSAPDSAYARPDEGFIEDAKKALAKVKGKT